jgi:hypothetical protein
MNRISSNTTGLSPVLKKLSPKKKGQEKKKKEQNRNSLGVSRQTRKMVQTTTKKQLLKSTMSYSSAISSVLPPILPTKNGTRRERRPVPKVDAPKAVATIDMVYVAGN